MSESFVEEAVSLRMLFHALDQADEPGLFATVLAPWLEAHAAGVRTRLASLAVYGRWHRGTYVFGDLLEQAYALSRISDVLLLGFQPELPPDVDRPWAHELHLPSQFPRITRDDYLAFFAALGMTGFDVAGFDPFFHEIVAVEQADDPRAPIEITGVVWPGLMLGEMLFNRAGVLVRAGAGHAVAGVADRSMLHEVFLRRHRDTSDESLGWGSNSQWKTDLRRDYLTSSAYHFNVDAEVDIDQDPQPAASLLTAAERRDLLQHRCLIRLPENTSAEHPYPGRWRLTVSRPIRPEDTFASWTS